VPRGKPEPDVFLEAARKLGVAPTDCVAFEDAPMGVVAAGRAGMRCVAVTTSYPPETLAATEPAPEIVVTDFDALLDGAGGWLLRLP
jgi:beta-phosphoglucomutase-like phosphatase (HAD superfamily)